MKIDRLLGIVIQLLNNERVNARALAGKFEVSVRTIQRDIETLARAGIPVVSSQGSLGGYGIMEGYKLDNRIMDTDDYYFIVTALRGLCSAYGNGLAEQALDKMLAVMPGARNAIPNHPNRHMVIDFGVFRESDHVARHIPMIEAAIEAKRVLEFDYTNAQHECTHRLAEPVAAVLQWHAWYLLAHCRMRHDYRLFRMARIRGLLIAATPFSTNHPLPEEILREMDEKKGRAFVRLKMLCRPEIRVSIEDYFPKGTFQDNPDGTFIMETRVPEDEPFWMGAILSYGDKVKVLEPASLRRGILEKARSLEVLYRSVNNTGRTDMAPKNTRLIGLRFEPVSSTTGPSAKRIIIEGLAEHFGSYDGFFNPDLTDVMDFYARPGRLLVVGLVNDEVVCTGGLVKEKEKTARIVRMSVARDYRGKGLGSRMLMELEERARGFGYDTIVLETNNDWHDALALYLRNGYSKVENDPECTHFVKTLIE